MTPTALFPSIPDALNLLTATGLILLAGILGARLVTRLLPVPAITGYVLVGLLIGPAGLHLINAETLTQIGPLVDLALGLVLFELGRRVDYKWLLRERRLLPTGILLATCSFIALFWLLTAFGVAKPIAIMVAAVGMATSPAVALNVVRETRAEGQLTERMLNIAVIGNLMAFVVLSAGLSALHFEYQAGWQKYLLHPLYLLIGSTLLGWVASRLLIWLVRWLGRDTQTQLIVVAALVAATVGVADMFNLSPLIAMLAFGVASRSQDSRYALVDPDFSQLSSLLYVVLFVFSGAHLEVTQLPQFALLALAFIILRLAVFTVLTTLFARANGISLRKGALLGLALVPLSGFKLVLIQYAAGAYPDIGGSMSALILSILVILEIVGPACTRLALVAAGETQETQK
jgi:Kef-type K+ transport system membrane component KefB